MHTFGWKTIGIVFGLSAIVFSMHYASNTGHSCCMPGAYGMMHGGMNVSPEQTTANAFKITANMSSPAKSGDNALDIAITNAAGKPIKGAKITASVAMTSMDMGTEHPSVKEVGNGRYAATVAFSMAGPWRITLKVVAPGEKPQTKSFDFMAG
jgi:hypothetical protein